MIHTRTTTSTAQSLRNGLKEMHMLRTPIARTNDPYTSHEAAAYQNTSGKRQSAAERCLSVVIDRPGLTAGEIGDDTGLGHIPAQRRLSDLKNAGKVVMGDRKQYKGSNQSTWWPVGQQALL